MTHARWIVAAAITGFSIGYWIAHGIGQFAARYWGLM